MTDTKKSTAFLIIVGLAIVWNLMGVLAFYAQMSMTPEALAALPKIEQDMYSATPAWVNIAFGIAVIAGTLGSLLLFLNKPISFYVLCLSLVGVLVQMSYVFFVSRAFEVYGPGQAVMPIMVIVIALALAWYSGHRFAKQT